MCRPSRVIRSALCACACARRVHWAFESLWLTMRSSAHLVGKSHVADVSDVFAGLFEFPASLCVHVCVSSTSASSLGLSGSPMHSTAPRTGKCGLSNVFSGVLSHLQRCAWHTICMPGQLSSPSVSSGQGLALLAVGESWSPCVYHHCCRAILGVWLAHSCR